MPQYKKGDQRPQGSGRKPGSKNKKSFLVLEVLENNGIDIVQKIIDSLPSLQPQDQVKALIALLPYCFPKLTAIEVSGGMNLQDERPLKEISNEDLDQILIDKD